MGFDWPLGLLGLLVVPLMLAGYLAALRRRRRRAVTYSSLDLVRKALPSLRSRWRRHLAAGLLLAGLVLMALATARPEITSAVPVEQSAIILALDDSGSMCSTDVTPNRLAAAEEAAKGFVDAQPSGVRLGLVVFSGFAELTVAPTTDHGQLDRAIENLSTAPGTAIGAAMLQALDAIASINPDVHPVGDAAETGALGYTPPPAATPTTLPPRPGKNGYVPDVVVLLTDGANNRGIAPLDAVPYAVARGVRVYTIGFGTTHPASLECTPQQEGGVAGGGFGRGGFGGGGGGFSGRSPLVADIPTLQMVAKETGASSYTARDASELTKVFAHIPQQITTTKQRHEVTSTFAALAALLVLVAIAAALRFAPYP